MIAPPLLLASARRHPRPARSFDALVAILKEETWLAKQKSARNRRTYRLDVRQMGHHAVIAWERLAQDR